jgi:hypothetical protein
LLFLGIFGMWAIVLGNGTDFLRSNAIKSLLG